VESLPRVIPGLKAIFGSFLVNFCGSITSILIYFLGTLVFHIWTLSFFGEIFPTQGFGLFKVFSHYSLLRRLDLFNPTRVSLTEKTFFLGWLTFSTQGFFKGLFKGIAYKHFWAIIPWGQVGLPH